MQAPDDFYVELPSNSSNNIFPDNTHSNYKVKLARPLMLDDDYEVALVEAFFLKNWHNIVNDDGKFSIFTRGVVHEFVVDSGLYEKSHQLIEAINRKILGILSPTALAQLRENVNIIFNIINGLQVGKTELLEVIPSLEKDLVNILKQSILPIVENRLKEQGDRFAETKAQLAKSNEYIESKAEGKLNATQDLFAHTHPYYVTPEGHQHLQNILRGFGIKYDGIQRLKLAINNTKVPIDIREEYQNADYTNGMKVLKEKRAELIKLNNRLNSLNAKSKEISVDLANAEAAAQLGGSPQKEKDTAFKKGMPYFSVNDETQKVIIAQTGLSSLTLSKTLLRMLGLDMNTENIVNDAYHILYTQGNHAINPVSDVNSLCIYSNVVQHEYVGDVMAPLLRIVHIDDNDGIRVTKTYPQSFYRPVSLRYIDTIEIDIKDMYGRLIQFSDGDVVVNKLHFRRRRQPLGYSK